MACGSRCERNGIAAPISLGVLRKVDYTTDVRIGALANGRYIVADVACDRLETNERDQS